ncbi:MAG TPA: low molecular weight protein tyrosine phosphatase family protein [Rhizomicrobium sp.]|nr:low molecular weight protein tyrosine phosphatase family protein [Rhizomicrobium sp.]
MKNVLFLCGRGRARSPTAEAVFADHDDIAAMSAGTSKDADTPLTADLVEWADVIFTMEASHRAKLSAQFRASLKQKRVICLDIPDKYTFMEPALVQLLKARVSRFLR